MSYKLWLEDCRSRGIEPEQWIKDWTKLLFEEKNEAI